MGANTKIEWARHTFNPVVGCTKISPACDHCYAADWAKRTGQSDLWNGKRRKTSARNWQEPIKWNSAAAAAGERHRVFCASLADVFDNQWEPEWRAELWALVDATPNLIWLLLTKRPQNIAEMLNPLWDGRPPRNVWLGTTIENKDEMHRRARHLKAVPAAVRFWSVEPLLEDLGDIPPSFMPEWIICGGESGPQARPMHPDWARNLRDQCKAADVPFFFKQWGEWGEAEVGDENTTLIGHAPEIAEHDCAFNFMDAVPMVKRGKKKTGRTLDDVEHNGFPEAA